MSTESTPKDATTHFGFTQVAEGEKAGLVHDVFDRVASKYDLMNDLMSLGVHRLWKNTLLDMVRPKADMTLIDVGGGTGDIALRFLERGGAKVGAKVGIIDINREMLLHGRRRMIDRGHITGLDWINGDAEALPVETASVDVCTTAFCIRNVTNIPRALEEMARILKPGGRFLCLEFSRVDMPVVDKMYDLYSFSVLPWLGQRIADDRASYQYLAESIRRFPDQRRFGDMIADAGLAHVTWRNLSGGIAAIHSAWRL